MKPSTRVVAWFLTLISLGFVISVAQRPPLEPSEVLAAGHALGGLHPRLSPDSSQIAFVYEGSIWVMPAAGGTAKRLTNGAGFDCEPAWSHDGQRIVFVNSPAMGAGVLQMIDATTGGLLPIPGKPRVVGTAITTRLEFDSPRNRVLAVFATPAGNVLAFCDLANGEFHTVTKLSPFGHFALSPDGESIAYSTTRDVDGQQMGNDGPQSDLWLIPAAGGEAKQLTRFRSRVFGMCWNAQGDRLIVVSDLGGAHNHLWEVPLNSDVPPLRLTSGMGDEERPSVSQNGRWVLYSDNQDGPTAFVLNHIRTGTRHRVAIERLDYGTPTGELQLTLTDPSSATPPTARVTIQDASGKFHAPPGALVRLLGDQGHFYCENQAKWRLPVGTYRLRISRGPEYSVDRSDFEIVADKVTHVSRDLNRWIDMPATGWVSGENHIHANYGYGEWYCTPTTMRDQCRGEDLHLCNFMVANSDTDGIFDREFFRGGPDPISTNDTVLYWNQEFRSTVWGHMTLINLKQLVEPIMTGFKDTTNPWDVPTNLEIARRTHQQGGLVNVTHVAYNPNDPYVGAYASKSLPLDVALGQVDSLDLNASYAGTVPLWYRLLNCGFRLSASAGTDTFLNRVRSRLPGGDRVYVKMDRPLTADDASVAQWVAALKAGKSFVTNGPMVELTVEGEGIGATIERVTPGDLHVRAEGVAQFPFDALEIIRDGEVVGQGKPSDGGKKFVFDGRVRLDQSGWIAVRAIGKNPTDLQTGPAYAHTSPVYVQIVGHPALCREDARYFVSWIERLALDVKLRNRFPTPAARVEVDKLLESARDVFQRKVAP